MTKEELIMQFDKLQEKFGSRERHAVYGGGEENNPRLCLVFINPTARNIATSPSWSGIRCQWLGTKQVWKFLTKAGLFDKNLNEKIQNMSSKDWTEEFCERVYDEVKRQGLYITNLAKCTQEDARGLPNYVFKEYRDLLFEELKMVNPQQIILFGNQVSSIVLGKNISVREQRKKCENLVNGDKNFECYCLYYPVGNGFFNEPKAVEDLAFILNK